MWTTWLGAAGVLCVCDFCLEGCSQSHGDVCCFECKAGNHWTESLMGQTRKLRPRWVVTCPGHSWFQSQLWVASFPARDSDAPSLYPEVKPGFRIWIFLPNG